jgi:hypothetical protein
MLIIYEIYQILFFASIIVLLYVLGDFGIKSYARFKLGIDTKLILPKQIKIALWVAISIIISFLTKPNIL